MGTVIFNKSCWCICFMLYIPLHCHQFQRDLIQYSVWDFGSFSKILDFPSQGWGMYLLSCYRCFSATTLLPYHQLQHFCLACSWHLSPPHQVQLSSSAAGPHPVTNLPVLSPSCQIQKWIVRDEIKTEPPRHFCRGQDRKWICCWWGTNGGGCSSQPGILMGAPDVEHRSYQQLLLVDYLWVSVMSGYDYDYYTSLRRARDC